MPPRQQAQRAGYTLVEVMVAMAVIGMGVVGLVGLQADAVQQQRGTHHQTLATLLARDLGERIRANPTAAASGDYTLAEGASVSTADCLGSDCTAAELARFDLAAWKGRAEAGLPGAKVRTTRSGTTYEIRLRWSGDSGCQSTTCVTLEVTP